MQILRTVFLVLPLVAPMSSHAGTTPASIQAAAPVRSLTVVGTARIDALPDEACIELTFDARDPTMPAAHKALRGHVKAFDKAVRSLGVEQLEQGATRYVADYTSSSGRRQLTGYHTSQQINVRTKEFDLIPAVVGLAAEHGLGSVNVVYYDTGMVGRKAEVRAAAVEAAKRKAEAMAEGFGVRLGPVRTVQEGGGSTGSGFGAQATNYVVAAAVDEVVAPMAPGSIPLSLSIEVTYDLVE